MSRVRKNQNHAAADAAVVEPEIDHSDVAEAATAAATEGAQAACSCLAGMSCFERQGLSLQEGAGLSNSLAQPCAIPQSVDFALHS